MIEQGGLHITFAYNDAQARFRIFAYWRQRRAGPKIREAVRKMNLFLLINEGVHNAPSGPSKANGASFKMILTPRIQ